MSTEDNVRCVCCGSDDAFVFLDLVLMVKKEVTADPARPVGMHNKIAYH